MSYNLFSQLFSEISPQVNFSNLLTKQDAERHVKDSVRKSKLSPCSSDMIDPTDSLNLTNPIYWPGWRRHVCETRTIFFGYGTSYCFFSIEKRTRFFPRMRFWELFVKFLVQPVFLIFIVAAATSSAGERLYFAPLAAKESINSLEGAFLSSAETSRMSL